jgi:hypothetical protein
MRTILILFAALAVAGEKPFDVALIDGKPRADQRTLRVAKGDEVVLHWSSDRPIVLHLHGYDVETKVAERGEATMRFTAGIAGRFPVSEHGRGAGHHRAVLYLEVLP